MITATQGIPNPSDESSIVLSLLNASHCFAVQAGRLTGKPYRNVCVASFSSAAILKYAVELVRREDWIEHETFDPRSGRFVRRKEDLDRLRRYVFDFSQERRDGAPLDSLVTVLGILDSGVESVLLATCLKVSAHVACIRSEEGKGIDVCWPSDTAAISMVCRIAEKNAKEGDIAAKKLLGQWMDPDKSLDELIFTIYGIDVDWRQ